MPAASPAQDVGAPSAHRTTLDFATGAFSSALTQSPSWPTIVQQRDFGSKLRARTRYAKTPQEEGAADPGAWALHVCGSIVGRAERGARPRSRCVASGHGREGQGPRQHPGAVAELPVSWGHRVDFVDSKTRSRMMSAVRAKDTQPELAIRRRLFARGFRYRLHGDDLPGTPDIVLPKYSAVIFVNGCFWHRHGCPHSQLPATRTEWWRHKLEGNKRRDQETVRELKSRGWRVLTVWECSFRTAGAEQERVLDRIADRAAKFLRSGRSRLEIPGNRRRGNRTGRKRR